MHKPPPITISAVVSGHRRNGNGWWLLLVIVNAFVQDLLLISPIACGLLSMLHPRIIVYIVNKEFCRFNRLVTYLASLEDVGILLTSLLMLWD